MRGVRYLLGVVGLQLFLILPHAFAATNPILIVAIQTGSSATANAEFVRLANTSASAVDVSGWKLQYKAATGVSWTTRATLQGSLQPKANILLATKDYVTKEVYQPLSSGLAAAGGHVQLIDQSGATKDLLGWGTATAPNGTAAPAPAANSSLERKTNSKGEYVNTGNNAADFATPKPSAIPSDSPQLVSTQSPVNIQITELLPNPAAPQTDTNDEFVELYNPSDKTISLKDFQLLSGSGLKTSYKFQGETIAPNSYAVVTSGGTNVSLTNSGGQVRLLAPNGKVLSESSAYDTAKDNYSWSLINDKWQWTTKATPGAINVAVEPPSAAKASKTKATKSKTTTKKRLTNTATDTREPENSYIDAQQPATVHPFALAIVGLGAIGYGAYEYRHDIKNRLHQFRTNRSARRAVRQET